MRVRMHVICRPLPFFKQKLTRTYPDEAVMEEQPQQLCRQLRVARDMIPYDAPNGFLSLRATLLVEALLQAFGLASRTTSKSYRYGQQEKKARLLHLWSRPPYPNEASSTACLLVR